MSDNSSNPNTDRESLKFCEFILYGVAAASFAGILSILGVEKLDTPLKLSLISFSFSLPAAIAFAFMLHPTSDIPAENALRPKVFAFYVLPLLVSFAGVACFLWHFSWIYGAVFLGTATILTGLLNWLVR